MVEGPKINNNHETFCITLAKIHFTDTICYLTHKSSRALNFSLSFQSLAADDVDQQKSHVTDFKA